MIKTILFHYTKRQQGVDKKKLQEFFFKLDFRTVSEDTGNFSAIPGGVVYLQDVSSGDSDVLAVL